MQGPIEELRSTICDIIPANMWLLHPLHHVVTVLICEEDVFVVKVNCL